jgi:hypothetical protein
MLAYSASPNAWFDEHAAETAQLYDGFFFSIGSWDGGVTQCLGLPGAPAADATWRERAKSNLAHLREAGATESLLTVCFGESEAWPSPDTLRGKEFTEKMARHFGAIGQAARELGFRGVTIDVEYPYRRYYLDHEVYTYEGYTSEDLMNAAAEQGRVHAGAAGCISRCRHLSFAGRAGRGFIMQGVYAGNARCDGGTRRARRYASGV